MELIVLWIVRFVKTTNNLPNDKVLDLSIQLPLVVFFTDLTKDLYKRIQITSKILQLSCCQVDSQIPEIKLLNYWFGYRVV